MEPKMLVGILLNLIFWPLIIYWIWVGQKNGREARKQYEEYNKPENQFNRRVKELRLDLSHIKGRLKYPYVLTPSFTSKTNAASPEIVQRMSKYDIFFSQNSVTTGKSEYILYERLNIKYDSKNLHFGNCKLYGFFPDIAYIDHSNKIYLDIEIDEPYSLKTKEPLHYFHINKPGDGKVFFDANEERDLAFVKYGWTVIRFSEEQVLKFPEECVNVIDYIICYWLQKKSSFDFALSPLKLQQRWNLDDSKLMTEKKHREI
jgi:hypothetical protein